MRTIQNLRYASPQVSKIQLKQQISQKMILLRSSMYFLTMCCTSNIMFCDTAVLDLQILSLKGVLNC